MYRRRNEARDSQYRIGKHRDRGSSGVCRARVLYPAAGDGHSMVGYTALTSSQSCEWSTPQDLFNELDKEFKFTVDVCASDDNAKCERYYTKSDNGLRHEWYGTCWMNPPYGRQVGLWIEKAYKASTQGVTVVCLLPARTDTRWFHDYCIKGELRWIRGRLRFGDGNGRATFPSFLCIFRGAK